MRSFMVVVLDSDLPREVALEFRSAFQDVIARWGDVTDVPAPEAAFLEFLNGEDEVGPYRRRKSVLERLYANEPSMLEETSV